LAVNLSGIGLSGTAIGTARETPESPPVAPQPDAGPQSNSAPAPGEVSITSTAALLAHLEQTLGAKPSVDPARVERLSRAIAEGRYKVEPEKIATSLMQSEHALSKLPLMEI
jgi:negative regulator of flagellin synthesis FlgM